MFLICVLQDQAISFPESCIFLLNLSPHSPQNIFPKEHYAEAVTMTEEEYQKLTAQHSKAFVDKCIEILNNYKLSSGKTYKSDYHTILNWVIERVAKDYPQLDKPVGIQNTVYDVNVNPFDQFL